MQYLEFLGENENYNVDLLTFQSIKFIKKFLKSGNMKLVSIINVFKFRRKITGPDFYRVNAFTY